MSSEILDNFIDFSNINNDEYISSYLLEKNIINEEELNYYPFILFTNHYKFNEELKSNLIQIINIIKSNLNNFSENEIIDYTKCLIIDTICSINSNCLCPIIYKYKLNFNYKINNQYNIIKKIIIAGKSQEDFNKSIELRIQTQEELNKSFELRLQIQEDFNKSMNNYNNYKNLLIFILSSIISYIFINFKLL